MYRCISSHNILLLSSEAARYLQVHTFPSSPPKETRGVPQPAFVFGSKPSSRAGYDGQCPFGSRTLDRGCSQEPPQNLLFSDSVPQKCSYILRV